MRVSKVVAAAALAIAAVVGSAGTSSADHTTRDLCSGVIEVDGCWYCAYQQLPTGHAPTNCHYGFTGYTWEQCTIWVTEVCIVGRITG